MSEHLTDHSKPTPESGISHEQAERSKTDLIDKKPAESLQKSHETSIESIRDSIKDEAAPAKPLEQSHPSHHESSSRSIGIDKDLKDQALFRTLKNLRQHLSAPERSLSRIIHQPVVDAVSELSGKTVARPSGVLGGGICAFIGSLVFLYYAKQTGFHYNYLLFIVFFGGGFVIGLMLEIFIRLVYRRRS